MTGVYSSLPHSVLFYYMFHLLRVNISYYIICCILFCSFLFFYAAFNLQRLRVAVDHRFVLDALRAVGVAQRNTHSTMIDSTLFYARLPPTSPAESARHG